MPKNKDTQNTNRVPDKGWEEFDKKFGLYCNNTEALYGGEINCETEYHEKAVNIETATKVAKDMVEYYTQQAREEERERILKIVEGMGLPATKIVKYHIDPNKTELTEKEKGWEEGYEEARSDLDEALNDLLQAIDKD